MGWYAPRPAAYPVPLTLLSILSVFRYEYLSPCHPMTPVGLVLSTASAMPEKCTWDMWSRELTFSLLKRMVPPLLHTNKVNELLMLVSNAVEPSFMVSQLSGASNLLSP